MDKVRISEIAQELGAKSKEIIEKAQEIGINIKTQNSSVTLSEAESLMNYFLTGVHDKLTKKTKKQTVDKPKDEQTIDKKDKKQSLKESEKSKKSEESKVENLQASKEPIEEKETLAQASLKKRRGLVIVKKKRPQLSKETPKQLEKSPEVVVKKKKKVKKVVVSKKDSSEKIDIFNSSDISDLNLIEDQLVFLHDFNFQDENEKEEKQKAREIIDRVNSKQNRVSNNKNFSSGQKKISKQSRKKRKKKKDDEELTDVKVVKIPEEIRVYEFAQKINKNPSEIIKSLFNLGVMVTKNAFLDKDAIEILADEFDVEVVTINPLDEFDYEKDYDLKEGDYVKSPVVTIMGHVDHGKTSLLDKIRSSKVASSEHGGITQHIGAYMVEHNGQKITFIDTPGHEAFTQMRSRGAQVTDIVIIVVAADDGVKPQTKEAIEHAKAANVPFIVAINKIDKPDANIDMTKSGLAELGVTPTDWGGEYEFVPVSAHSGEGIDDLLEVLLLQAELLELRANPDLKAKATVVESSLEKGRGAVATVIMQNGTLRVGDTIVCGVAYGKVKTILNEDSKTLKALLPGEPGVVVGLSQVPVAGDVLIGVENEKVAREYANKRAEYIRQKELSKSTKVTIEELGAKIAEGKIKNLPVILKADVAGSLEAIKSSLEKLKNEEVQVNIISSGVGGITQSDLALAEASENCVILGFNVRPTGVVKEQAKKMGIQINTYNVIYALMDDVKSLLGGLLSPIISEENLGQAEVREVFSVPKVGLIAGCIVSDGVINRGAKVRVIRDGVVIYEGEISSLKRFKDDVREVAKGFECGIGIVGYNDIKPGDFLESFKEVEEKATLE